jgi:hypothetical protein
MTSTTKAERKAQLRAMTPEQNKAAYIQLCESKGYHRRDLGNGITCMVTPEFLAKYDAGLYDTTYHYWHPSVRGAGQAVICVSA